jgi:hypothetical protein
MKNLNNVEFKTKLDQNLTSENTFTYHNSDEIEIKLPTNFIFKQLL